LNRKKIIASTTAYVRGRMSGEGSGHDWWHTYRVWKTALRIAEREKGADAFVVQLGALLHDIADWKFSGGDEAAGERAARAWLRKAGADAETVERVGRIVGNVSFKGAGVRDTMDTLEGRIVQDADRLDAIGAIGIARAFAYGGYRGRLLYDPAHKPESHMSFGEYKSSSSPSINHFYEKLFLLKGRMHTGTARRIARERDAFMRLYVRRFFREWDGKE
jgi:uncharacterized protein